MVQNLKELKAEDTQSLMTLVTATNVVWSVCRQGIDPRILDTMTMTLAMTDALATIYKKCIRDNLIAFDHNQSAPIDPKSDEDHTSHDEPVAERIFIEPTVPSPPTKKRSRLTANLQASPVQA